MLQARAAGLIGRLPAHHVIAATSGNLGGANAADGRAGIQPVHDFNAQHRRLGVQQHLGLGPDLGTRNRIKPTADGVADKAGTGALGVVGRQQAVRAVLQQLTGFGVDRLQHPAGGAGGGVDAGRHPQDEAAGGAEIKLTLEHRPVAGQVDGDVADADVAQAEAALAQIVIEHADDAHLVGHRARFGRVGIADGVGQRGIGGHKLLAAIALRAGDRDRAGGLPGLVEQGLQGQR